MDIRPQSINYFKSINTHFSQKVKDWIILTQDNSLGERVQNDTERFLTLNYFLSESYKEIVTALHRQLIIYDSHKLQARILACSVRTRLMLF